MQNALLTPTARRTIAYAVCVGFALRGSIRRTLVDLRTLPASLAANGVFESSFRPTPAFEFNHQGKVLALRDIAPAVSLTSGERSDLAFRL